MELQKVETESLLNPTPERLLAVGDIHGCLKPLEALLEAARLTQGDSLVVLGDFINRGPQSRQVIDRLIALGTETRLIVILGNHEEELLLARRDAAAYGRWLQMGGDQTLRSYELASERLERWPEVMATIPQTHWQFLDSAYPYWETPDFIFAHAGYDCRLPLEEQSSLHLRWLSLKDKTPLPHYSGKTAIVGHTPNLSGQVIDYGFLRCLDTGCGLGGVLTMMELHTRHYWQCPENSEKVIWS